jgi:UTP--glucose-1-phosphate uridylyltransferase
MQIKKAVITAAGPSQRRLPMQTLIDEHGVERSVLSLIIKEALRAGVDQICVVVCPGDEESYSKLGDHGASHLSFVQQAEPRGYGHAVYCARDFVKDDPFLHLVGDHIYVSDPGRGGAQALVEVAAANSCSVSGVQITRENLLPYYGAVGGQSVPGKPGLYRIETVIEKPTPTEAEQSLVVPGLRSGQYLCFYGMHVLTPAVMGLLESRTSLSSALAELSRLEHYLAFIQSGRRYDVGVKYGLFQAQLALALAGDDRDRVLAQLLEVVAGARA